MNSNTLKSWITMTREQNLLLFWWISVFVLKTTTTTNHIANKDLLFHQKLPKSYHIYMYRTSSWPLQVCLVSDSWMISYLISYSSVYFDSIIILAIFIGIWDSQANVFKYWLLGPLSLLLFLFFFNNYIPKYLSVYQLTM